MGEQKQTQGLLREFEVSCPRCSEPVFLAEAPNGIRIDVNVNPNEETGNLRLQVISYYDEGKGWQHKLDCRHDTQMDGLFGPEDRYVGHWTTCTGPRPVARPKS